jgi:hypothetical protein
MLAADMEANQSILGLTSLGCYEPVLALGYCDLLAVDRIRLVLQSAPLKLNIIKELTEEEMRQALFGNAELPTAADAPSVQEPHPTGMTVPPAKAATKERVSKAFTPRLKVILRVGNEFEGETYEISPEADTLSTHSAEQEATKAARKKFRYVEVISIKSM